MVIVHPLRRGVAEDSPGITAVKPWGSTSIRMNLAGLRSASRSCPSPTVLFFASCLAHEHREHRHGKKYRARNRQHGHLITQHIHTSPFCISIVIVHVGVDLCTRNPMMESEFRIEPFSSRILQPFFMTSIVHVLSHTGFTVTHGIFSAYADVLIARCLAPESEWIPG